MFLRRYTRYSWICFQFSASLALSLSLYEADYIYKTFGFVLAAVSVFWFRFSDSRVVAVTKIPTPSCLCSWVIGLGDAMRCYTRSNTIRSASRSDLIPFSQASDILACFMFDASKQAKKLLVSTRISNVKRNTLYVFNLFDRLVARTNIYGNIFDIVANFRNSLLSSENYFYALDRDSS